MPSWRHSRWRLLAVGALCTFLIILSDGCHRDIPVIDLAGPGATTATPVPTGDRPALRVAVGAMLSPERTRDLYGEFLRRVASKLGRLALIAQRRTYAEIDTLLAEHQVDLAFVCSGPYVRDRQRGIVELLAVPVAGGATRYCSYIVVPRDSRIRSFDDLRGRRFVFTDPESLTGHAVPLAMLAHRHTTPRAFFETSWFSHAHDLSIKAVATGRADAAAVDSLVFDWLKRTDPGAVAPLRILARSRAFGIPPVVIPRGLDPNLATRLLQVFLSLHRDPVARPLLRRLGIERFVAGTDRMYDSVRQLLAIQEASRGVDR